MKGYKGGGAWRAMSHSVHSASACPFDANGGQPAKGCHTAVVGRVGWVPTGLRGQGKPWGGKGEVTACCKATGQVGGDGRTPCAVGCGAMGLGHATQNTTSILENPCK